MKSFQITSSLVFILILVLLLLTTPAQAAPDSRIDLVLSKTKIKVGDLVTANVLVKGAPDIYGADVRLVFDPAFFSLRV